MAEQTSFPIVMLRRSDLLACTGLSKAAVYDKMNPRSPRYDPTFPKQVKLGAKSVGWPQHLVMQWLQSRINASCSS